MAKYVVKSGDSLSKIAWLYYGDMMAYPQIAQANNIIAPYTIEPGQVLTIPGVGDPILITKGAPVQPTKPIDPKILLGGALLLFALFS